jgi:hypothetical protein
LIPGEVYWLIFIKQKDSFDPEKMLNSAKKEFNESSPQFKNRLKNLKTGQYQKSGNKKFIWVR